MTAKDLWFSSLEKGNLFGNRLYPNDEIKINNKVVVYIENDNGVYSVKTIDKQKRKFIKYAIYGTPEESFAVILFY